MFGEEGKIKQNDIKIKKLYSFFTKGILLYILFSTAEGKTLKWSNERALWSIGR